MEGKAEVTTEKEKGSRRVGIELFFIRACQCENTCSFSVCPFCTCYIGMKPKS